MIVTRGLGRAVITGAIVAAGLGLNAGVTPPQPPYQPGGSWAEPVREQAVEFTDEEILTIVQTICVSGLLES